MPSADFWSHELSCLNRPAFRASPTHGYASRSPRIRVCTFAAQVRCLPVVLSENSFVILGPLTSASRPASTTFLFVTLQLWRDRVQVANIKPGVYAFDRRLPLHGQSPFRSCLRLKLLLLRFTFGILPIKRVPKLFRGLADLTISGTPQVHAHVGRTDDHKPRAARFLKSMSIAAAR